MTPRRWGLRYRIRNRQGLIVGTLLVPLDHVPRGRAPIEVAKRHLDTVAHGCTAVLPVRVLLDDPPALEGAGTRGEKRRDVA